MQINRVPPHRGLAWLVQAARLGLRHPRTIFGAGLLLVATLYATGLLFLVPLKFDTGSGAADFSQLLMAAVPLFVVMVLLLPVLLGGLMHVVHEAASGRPVRARDLFAPIREGRMRSLILLGGVQILLAAASTLIVAALAGGDYWRDYGEMVKAAMNGSVPVAPQPAHPLLLSLVQLIFNYFSTALMLFCLPLLLFARATLVDAVRDSLKAAVRNIGANMLAGLLFLASVLAVTLAVSVVTAVLVVVSNALHPLVAALLTLGVTLAYGAALVSMLVASAYFAWRDIFGPSVRQEAGPHQIEL
ncbi:BPSS1780 family membrane protein [Frateuria sp.]|uniref:BPSS1780 family membrane protein n=1 Tax=Frateuria sp. TaxID=2211372 RepID=UPI00181F1CD1|nr:BPSS1780 family membrane protein [Frateuria sp.]NUR21512.1 hypothetical protein [Frateuria sp.]